MAASGGIKARQTSVTSHGPVKTAAVNGMGTVPKREMPPSEACQRGLILATVVRRRETKSSAQTGEGVVEGRTCVQCGGF